MALPVIRTYFFFFLQHARGFIDGCANRVTLISWEAEHRKNLLIDTCPCEIFAYNRKDL